MAIELFPPKLRDALPDGIPVGLKTAIGTAAFTATMPQPALVVTLTVWVEETNFVKNIGTTSVMLTWI